MSEKTAAQAEAIDHALEESVLVNATSAPIIYFESVTNQGGVGIVNVTLAAMLHLLDRDGRVGTVPSVVAHLRCPRGAAIALRDSLNKAIANGETPPDASVN